MCAPSALSSLDTRSQNVYNIFLANPNIFQRISPVHVRSYDISRALNILVLRDRCENECRCTSVNWGDARKPKFAPRLKQ